ncbi:MAG: restriction endonuclease subunit M [Chloroflexi bacterium]|nr:restriction endonuclease subunit M [Chloroflexota bacterium]
MSTEPFAVQLDRYLTAIREARTRGASHDYLRQVFIDFAKGSFGVDPMEVDLERGIKGTRLRGSIDALYQDIVFEFKRDLRTERDKGKEELGRYLASLGDKQVYFGVLTDGLTFEVYLLREGHLDKIDGANLERLSPEDAFLWFDAFLLSQKALAPTPHDVVRRFGDTSLVFNSSLDRLARMAHAAREDPTYQVKYDEWAKLLAKVYGHSVARPGLFLRHTYLSLLAKLLAYAALYRDRPMGVELRDVVSGRAFVYLPDLAQEDFFCWVLSPGLEKDAEELLRGLSQHLSTYDLAQIDQDLLKELYENLVDRETKHDLGEVYTPDWLAELTLREAGFGPGKSLLDPTCGSGTFLFTAIRMLREHGVAGTELVSWAVENIVGVDVHPLAVTIAKVNYLLALAPDLPGYGQALRLPVYMADSLLSVQGTNVGALVRIPAGPEDNEVFAIPGAMAEDPQRLDRVIEEMRHYSGADLVHDAAKAGFSAFLEGMGLSQYGYIWRPNLRLMRKLCAAGRDTIWTFILKNGYRPAYLRFHPFDMVAGNPPWLAYHYITDPTYQAQVKDLVMGAQGYGLLSRKEVKLFTHMEMATVFFALAADVYLKRGGTIAFVMPRSVLTGAKQHTRFQDVLRGNWLPAVGVEKVLDLGDPEAGGVKPVFKVGSCVLIARRAAETPVALPDKVARLSLSLKGGPLPRRNLPWAVARKALSLKRQRLLPKDLFPPAANPSPYLKDIREGATLVPRSFWFVRPAPEPRNIVDEERPEVVSDPEVVRTAKKPWQNVSLRDQVEARYLYATLLSRQLLPFGYTSLSLCVLPIEQTPAGLRLVKKDAALVKGHVRLYHWLRQAQEKWQEKRKAASAMDIYDRLDYQHLLTSQHPTGYYTLALGKPGTKVACCVVAPGEQLPEVQRLRPRGFISYENLFIYQTKSADEAHYICGFVNAPYVDEAIKSSQTRGAWGARDVQRRPFEVLPIPKFDPEDQRHLRLAEISRECHAKVAGLALQGQGIGRLRGQVRLALAAELAEIDRQVRDILSA